MVGSRAPWHTLSGCLRLLFIANGGRPIAIAVISFDYPNCKESLWFKLEKLGHEAMIVPKT